MADETRVTRTVESDGVHLVGAAMTDYNVSISVVSRDGGCAKELADEIAEAVHEVVDE